MSARADVFDSPRPVSAQQHAEIIAGNEWDRQLASFDDACFEQTAVYNETRWRRATTEYLRVKDGPRTVGGAAVIVRSIPMTGSGIAIVKWGPVWREESQEPCVTDLDKTLAMLQEIYCHRRRLYLTIIPPANPVDPQLYQSILDERGFRRGPSLSYPDRYFVDLKAGRDDLRRGLDRAWRRNLRKTGAEQFEIKWSDSASDLDVFLSLYRQMHARKRFVDKSGVSTLGEMLRSTIANVRPKIALAYHEGVAHAGVIVWIGGDTASYMFGATSSVALNLRLGYAIQWWIVEQLARKPRLRWYDLGGDNGQPGLRRFKQGLAGRFGRVVAAPARYDFAATRIARLAGTSGFAARKLASRATQAAHLTRMLFK